MFNSIKSLPTAIVFGVAAVVSGNASAQVLIDATTNNGSFETEDGEPKHTDWGDVAFWSLWDAAAGGPATASNDSGTEASGAATQGSRVAFLQGGNAAYNATSHVVQAGDVFAYTWDWALAGRGDAVAGLAYETFTGSGIYTQIAGTTSTNPDTLVVYEGLGGSYTAQLGDAAIGNVIALTIESGGSYPEVDDFRLTVNASAVPEPGSFAFLLLTGAAVAARRRRC